MDINNTEVLGRIVKCTPAIEGRVFTFISFTDPATGKPAQIEIKPGRVQDVVTIIHRFPALKTLVLGGEGASRFDAFAIAGFPALVAVVAMSLGRHRDAKFEEWIASWPEDDLFAYIKAWREITMPEGIKSFFGRVVRYLAAGGACPEAAVPMVIAHLEKLDSFLVQMMTNLVEMGTKALENMKLPDLEMSPATTDQTTKDDTPTTSSSPSATSQPSSKSEDVELTLGL